MLQVVRQKQIYQCDRVEIGVVWQNVRWCAISFHVVSHFSCLRSQKVWSSTAFKKFYAHTRQPACIPLSPRAHMTPAPPLVGTLLRCSIACFFARTKLTFGLACRRVS